MQSFLHKLGTIVRQHRLLCLLINSVTALQTLRSHNPYPSAFSATTCKPSLGAGFAYISDVQLLVQSTAQVFVLDENEKREGAGRSVVEVLKNRFGVSHELQSC